MRSLFPKTAGRLPSGLAVLLGLSADPKTPPMPNVEGTTERQGRYMPAKADLAHAESPIMTVTEIAFYLRVNRTTVYRMLKRGEIPAFRVGSDWRFNRQAIDHWRLTQTGQ